MDLDVLSFSVVPSISTFPRGSECKYSFGATCVQKPLHHKDLSLPNINKVYDPDLNVPLVLNVLHRRGGGEK